MARRIVQSRSHWYRGALKRTDPRCKKRGPVSAEDQEALKQLGEIVKALTSKTN